MKSQSPKQSSLFGAGEVCVFCRIVKKEIESYPVFEDSKTLAFLDTKPLFPGHMLLVPKQHYQDLEKIPAETIAILFNNAKLLSRALEDSINADGEFIAVNNKVSQSVPHLHIHIVPRKFKDGLKGFFWPRYKYSGKEEMLKIQEKIVKALEDKRN